MPPGCHYADAEVQRTKGSALMALNTMAEQKFPLSPALLALAGCSSSSKEMRAATAREATEEKARAGAPASLLRLPSGKRARSEGSMAGPGAAEAEESE
mmetsp:Transcript_11478/g.24597  ORF Transcript_11478/g.24597 Transcript_11478/m.24597 type:complete len:99 (-) Transcript_11478:1181-1477(-)